MQELSPASTVDSYVTVEERVMPQAAAKAKRTVAKSKKDREQKKRDRALDEGLKESFPGSDPVSITQPAPTQPEQEPENSDQAAADKPGRDEKQPA